MSKVVRWFDLDEEFTIGFATIGGKDVFITEEAVRFDAPLVRVHETLREAVLRKCFLDEDDLEDPEEKRYFNRTLKRATKEYEEEKKRLMLLWFLDTMDATFSNYDCMKSYKFDRDARTMWLSEEENDGYIWSALDGALILWNSQNKPYYIICDENAPNKNGMIKWEFEIKKEE